MPGTGLLRRAEERSVTDIELFFDLVYVSAVTQPSHRLLEHTTLGGAIETAVLLALVWQAWAHTTWVTNWLDADRTPVRLMLVGVMLVSLLMSVALPRAFADRGLWAARTPPCRSDAPLRRRRHPAGGPASQLRAGAELVCRRRRAGGGGRPRPR